MNDSMVAARWRTLVVPMVAILICVGLRLHGFDEPLDCDEAAYAYVGRTIYDGGAPYVDAIENKPPLAYWINTLAIYLGGYNEASIRWISFPFVILTAIGIWRLALEMLGEFEAGLAVFFYAIVSSDPFTFADSSNLEVFQNAFLVWSFWAAFRGAQRVPRYWLLCGFLLALSTLIKQTTALHLLFFGLWVLSLGRFDSKIMYQGGAMFLVGFGLPCLATVAWLYAKDALWPMIYYAFEYGPQMTQITGESSWQERVKQLVFGRFETSWWAAGSWPLIALAIVGCLNALRLRKFQVLAALIGWQTMCVLEVFIPGLYWQHYYLILTPGFALLASLVAIDADEVASNGLLRKVRRFVLPAVTLIALVYLQSVHYLLLTPEEIMRKNKNGEQWVYLREIGREMGMQLDKIGLGDEPIFVWGYQSPLYIYTGKRAPTAKMFMDNLQYKYLDQPHPLIDPLRNEIIIDLHESPPAIIFVGAEPFAQLRQLLEQRYVPANSREALEAYDDRGIFLRPDVLARLRELAK